jgi:hypothetical protein
MTGTLHALGRIRNLSNVGPSLLVVGKHQLVGSSVDHITDDACGYPNNMNGWTSFLPGMANHSTHYPMPRKFSLKF